MLLDDVACNGESWFVARCFELARREGVVGVISFSDPVPRSTTTGRLVLRGHVGVVYQASNAIYAGRGDARTLKLLPDGSVFNHRAEGKLRRGERGWQHVLRQLQRHGAGPWTGDGATYLARWLPELTRPLKHPGNHRYLFGLDRAAKRALPSALAAAGLRGGALSRSSDERASTSTTTMGCGEMSGLMIVAQESNLQPTA